MKKILDCLSVIGKLIWSGVKRLCKFLWKSLPWIGLFLWLACILSLPIMHAYEKGDLKTEIAALKAENAMYEQENDYLQDEIEWLRSLAVQDTEVTP